MNITEKSKVATRLDIAVFIILTCLSLVALVVLGEFTEIPYVYNCLICILSYLFLLAIWADIRTRRQSLASARTLDVLLDTEFGKAALAMNAPVLLCDESGNIFWCNKSFERKSGFKRIRGGINVSDIFDFDILDDETENDDPLVYINEDAFRCDSIPLTVDGKAYRFVVFEERTDYLALEKLYGDECPVVAYAIVDNIDEIIQYVHADFVKTINAVEDKLKKWVASMNGIIRSYERNKYFITITAENLRKCVEDSFSILDEIREVRVGDGISITVSIGISDTGDSLADIERSAQNALDMALQRGGDQVVYRKLDGHAYYGGKTKAAFKRTNVRARVMANQFSALLARADKAIIMGHRMGDYDSFGASIGMARFAMNHNVGVNIVVNKRDPNLAKCFEKIENIETFRNIFVDSSEGMDLLTPDTLVVLVDVNNFNIAEAPELIKKAKNIAIIDHHIKAAEFDSSVKFEYIETTASSASELVSEFLEQNMTTRNLSREESELLLSGILLDTKQFTRNTGTRTFGVAQFLRGEGADPGKTQEMFKADVDELIKEAKFNTNVNIYKRRFAISACDEEFADSSYRTIAAKVSDKLLSLKGIEASFVLVNIGGNIHICGRSIGTVNVQKILERLNGGGHFDVAGAQVSDDSMRNVVSRLQAAIDENNDKM
jgi:c-di-AMP phosphodiesterase-like protein